MNGSVHTATPQVENKSLYRLIAEYWLAYDHLMGVSDLNDDAAIKAACERVHEAELEIFAYVPHCPIAAEVKAKFVGYLAAQNDGYLEPEEIGALLSTLPRIYAQERAA